MPTTATELVTEDQLRQFRTDGYFILKSVVGPEHLDLLRSEAQFSIDRMNAEMDATGTDVIGINHRGKRYFTSNVFRDRPVLRKFLFSDLMADICRATLGPEAYLFWEQYVIKCADAGMNFSWHQDSGYVGPNHKPYLTCWIPLDDVTEANGTVYILPQSTLGIRTWVKHEQDPRTNDMVGYFGKDRGVPVIVPAGSIAVFSSFTFHSSGANLTNKMRRVYLAQYSSEIITKADGNPWGNAEPFLHAGQNIGVVAPL